MVLAQRTLLACIITLGALNCSVRPSLGNASVFPFSKSADAPPYIPGPDCNTNGVDDTLDISGGTSIDCDGNGSPDECDWDLDGDGVPWVCDPCVGFPNIDSDHDEICDSMDMCAGHDSFCDAPDNVIFVWPAAPGGNTGRNWYNAYNHVGAALYAYPTGKEIWVAAGTYYTDGSFQAPGGSKVPVTGGGFDIRQLWNPVSVYGGFSATETSRDQRDWQSNIATISADEDADGTHAGNRRVIIELGYGSACGPGSEEPFVFDGLTISGAGSPGELIYDSGGGVSLGCGVYTFRNCTFEDNLSYWGGGIYARNANLTIENCRFTSNEAQKGAGIYVDQGTLDVQGSTFSDNTLMATSGYPYGGGIYDQSISSLISDCTFTGNLANHPVRSYGGGAYLNGEATVVRDCVFIGNSAQGYLAGGSGIAVGGDAVIEGCRFLGNMGTGLFADRASPAIRNCEFVGNQESGVYAFRGLPTLVNSTITQNGNGVIGYFNEPSFSGNVELSNCLVWRNAASPQVDSDRPGIVVNHSLVEGGWSGIGHGNIDTDPLFVDVDGPDDIIGTLDDDLRLLPNSPCIDTGSNGWALPDFITDIAGNPRAAGCVVDMGAYEFGAEGLGDVDSDGLSDECDPDNDNDGVLNADDVCAATPTGQQVTPWGAPKGDINDDCVPTAADHEYFEICLWLSGPQQEPIFADCVGAFDFDGDNDVDLNDFSAFARVVN